MAAEKIAIASDHGGTNLKQAIIDELSSKGFDVLDLGCDGSASVDYPDYGYKLAEAIKSGAVARGVVVCGSGIGISIAVNRFPEIRCALVHDRLGASLSREHNNANVIAFGERTTGVATALDALDAFLNTEFEGGRHERRVEKLSNPPL